MGRGRGRGNKKVDEMKDELTDIEDKIWQDIKAEMKRQGITLEK